MSAPCARISDRRGALRQIEVPTEFYSAQLRTNQLARETHGLLAYRTPALPPHVDPFVGALVQCMQGCQLRHTTRLSPFVINS